MGAHIGAHFIKDKKRLHRRWIKVIETEDETSKRQSCIRTRNKVNSLLVQTKRQYERSICNISLHVRVSEFNGGVFEGFLNQPAYNSTMIL